MKKVSPRPAHLRHARHYIQVADQAQQHYLSGGEGITHGLALFDHILLNLDQARVWLQKQAGTPEIDTLLSADANATALIGDLRYSTRDGRIPQFIGALAAAQRLGDRRAEGQMLGNLGSAYVVLEEAQQAIELHEQSLAIVRELDDRQGEGQVLGNLGIAYTMLGEVQRAIELYEQDLALVRELGDRRGEGIALGNLGIAYKNLGDIQRAIELQEQNLAIAREVGDRHGEGRALGNLATAYVILGDMQRASELYEQDLAISRELGDRRGESVTLNNLAGISVRLGDMRRTIELYEQQLLIVRELRDRRGEGTVLGNLGIAYARLGKPRWAIERYQQALTIARELGDRRVEGNSLGNLGLAYELLEEPRQAIESYEQVLVIMREIGDRDGEERALQSLGNAYSARGDAQRASELYEQCLVITRELGDRKREARTLWDYGLALVRSGKPAQALPLLESSLAFSQATGDQRAAEQAAAISHIRQQGTLPKVGRHDDQLAALPGAVRAAIKQRDGTALQAALSALPPDESAAIVTQLQQAGIISMQHALDMAQVVQNFRPLLGDIALAAQGDTMAQLLAETAMPFIEQRGWRIGEATRHIWAGERDAEVLTAGLDSNSAALVRHILRMVAGGPEMIFVAGAIEIRALRRQADAATAQILADGEITGRAELAAQLEHTAGRAEQLPVAPWQELADHLRVLIARLREME